MKKEKEIEELRREIARLEERLKQLEDYYNNHIKRLHRL